MCCYGWDSNMVEVCVQAQIKARILNTNFSLETGSFLLKKIMLHQSSVSI